MWSRLVPTVRDQEVHCSVTRWEIYNVFSSEQACTLSTIFFFCQCMQIFQSLPPQPKSLSLLYIRVFFIHFTFLLSFFPPSFPWILSAPCNETWRESGNLLVMQCACLHIFIASSFLSRFLRYLCYRLVIVSKPLDLVSNRVYWFRAQTEAAFTQ